MNLCVVLSADLHHPSWLVQLVLGEAIKDLRAELEVGAVGRDVPSKSIAA